LDVVMNSRYVGVGVGRYDSPTYAPVARAAENARELGAYLEELGISAVCLDSPTNAEVQQRLAESLPGARAVVLYWTGHGKAENQQDLRLITRNTSGKATGSETCLPANLVEDALAAGAKQILVILDTCYSGAGVVPGIQAAAKFADMNDAAGVPRWVGIVTSCQSYEKAVSGRFMESLLKLLRDGPSTSAFRTHWSAHNEGLRGSDLVDAIREEWSHEFQQLGSVTFGWPQPMLPNPRHDRNAPDRLVDHLVLAARGAAPGEDGWYFTGRRRALRQIVARLGEGRPGLLVVTGPAGSGKSAVIGRVACLASAVERAALPTDALPSSDDPDPGVGAVDAVLYARGQSYDSLLADLARTLGTPGVVSVYGILDQLIKRNVCPAVIIDALDEAQAPDVTRICGELLVPLATRAQVLVGTRRKQVANGQILVDLLASAIVLDLAEEHDTAADIEHYVQRRLVGTANAGIPAIAAEIAARSSGPDGGFLYARMVTSRLRERPLDVATAGWADALRANVCDAFEHDLLWLPEAFQRGRKAARDLLTALAWSYGRGLPAREVWPMAASGVADSDDETGSAERTRYSETDVDWVLNAMGHYVIESGEDGQAVYRLFHQQLVECLGHDPAQGARLDRAVESLWTRQSAEADAAAINPYLRQYRRAHRLRGATARAASARRHHIADPAAGQPELAAALAYQCRVLADDGRRAEALGPALEAVEHYRQLVLTDAAAYRLKYASALNALASREADCGNHEQSLAAAQLSVDAFRELAALDPVNHLPAFAGALNNLAMRAAAVGHHRKALVMAQEAVTIYRSVAASQPDKYLPTLAMALSGLAQCEARLGNAPAALEHARESVALRRRLVEQAPQRYAPVLAASLHNLANRLAEVGLGPEALAAVEEAVAIRRTLAQTNSAAYLPALALSLSNLADRLGDLGRPRDALAAAEESVVLKTKLAQTNAAAPNPDLATALTALSNRQANLGRHESALASAEAATKIFRELADSNPAHLVNVAGSLTNLATRLAAIGYRDTALTAAHEAVRLYRPLADGNPAQRFDLAAALNILGNCELAIDRPDRAAPCFDEALSILRAAPQMPRRRAQAEASAQRGLALAVSIRPVPAGPEDIQQDGPLDNDADSEEAL
jgi:hypothetical protein